jgi:1-deoxy-D-xylulose-5-phosphate reductoisomerase
MEKLVILGSTGSIGTQTLQIVDEHPERFEVHALVANNQWETLAQQALRYRPRYVLLHNLEHADKFKLALSGSGIQILEPSDLLSLCEDPDGDVIVNSLVGFSGFHPTYAALKAGKIVALANKESLVVGGQLLKQEIGYSLQTLRPIDSEHSALWQCLVGESLDQVDRLIITASGGPFRTFTHQQLQQVTVDQALKHPNWEMGAKITIDSSTLMNKGLEIIEAYWLFGIPLSRIDAVVHPQSIIHSMVLFKDGSIKAQMGYPDMRLPIQYALSAPDRWNLSYKAIDWQQAMQMTFEPVDLERFPCLALARQALESGGFYPTVLNAANEVAVSCFLKREIPYIHISKIVEQTLSGYVTSMDLSLESITHVDMESRRLALSLAHRP